MRPTTNSALRVFDAHVFNVPGSFTFCISSKRTILKCNFAKDLWWSASVSYVVRIRSCLASICQSSVCPKARASLICIPELSCARTKDVCDVTSERVARQVLARLLKPVLQKGGGSDNQGRPLRTEDSPVTNGSAFSCALIHAINASAWKLFPRPMSSARSTPRPPGDPRSHQPTKALGLVRLEGC